MNDLLDFSSNEDVKEENDEKIFSVLSSNIKNNNKKTKFKSSKLSEWFVK